MHFSENRVDAPFFIKTYQTGSLHTTTTAFNQPVVLFQDQALCNLLPAKLQDLKIEHIEALARYEPQLVLLGTGSLQIFPDPALFVPFFQKKIGFEIMSTDAAARTYNLLLAEDRAVLAALFV